MALNSKTCIGCKNELCIKSSLCQKCVEGYHDSKLKVYSLYEPKDDSFTIECSDCWFKDLEEWDYPCSQCIKMKQGRPLQYIYVGDFEYDLPDWLDSTIIDEESDLPDDSLDYSECELQPDNVNHPTHYTFTEKFEVMDVIDEAVKHLSGTQAFALGNVIKYLLRFPYKNGFEDVKKARVYLDKFIKSVELDGESWKENE